MRVFIDTNLWTYRLDGREPAKRERIKQWLAEAALRSRCDVLFSEDFNHGGRIGQLQLINPLASDAL